MARYERLEIPGRKQIFLPLLPQIFSEFLNICPNGGRCI